MDHHTHPAIGLTGNTLRHLEHHECVAVNLFLVKVLKRKLLNIPLESAFVFESLEEGTLQPAVIFV